MKHAKPSHVARRRRGRLVALGALAAALCVVRLVGLGGSADAAAPPAVVAPEFTGCTTATITIDQGGTYAPNVCTPNRDPAVVVTTTAPVVLDGARLRGHHHLVVVPAGGNVTVRNSYAEGLWSSTACDQHGRFVWAPNGVSNLTVERNDVVRAAAVKVQGGVADAIKVRYNRARDIYGDSTNSCGGGYMQFAQFSGVVANDLEVAWNEVVNRPDASRTEDLVSLFGGTRGADAAHPVRVHHNLLWGSSPLPAASGTYSGGGIMVGDEGSRWIEVTDNTVLDTTNYGINVVCASDTLVTRNRIVSDGRLDDGTWVRTQNVGLSVAGPGPSWNRNCGSGDHERNRVEGNDVGWTRGPGSAFNNSSSPSRGDFYLNSAGPGGSFVGNRSIRPDQVISASDVQSEYDRWDSSRRTAGVDVGRSAAVSTTTTAAPTTTTPPTTTPPTTPASTVPPTPTVPTPPTTAAVAPPDCHEVPELDVVVCRLP